MRTPRLIALAAAALLALAACSGAASTPAPTAAPTSAPTAAPAASGAGGGAGQAVSIKNFAFNPPTTTAKVGDKVTWTNGDSTAHTVTFDAPVAGSTVDSGNVDAGATFSNTFSAAGTFTYHCKIHPTMKGTITVS